MKKLYFGDNLDILREHIADESVDLVYLDPPFNSKRDYNLLFKTQKGHSADAQITAFEDSWHWGEQAEREYNELLRQSNTDVAEMMRALRSFLGENDMMAYLVMMANRLIELHRILKPTGSLYLHCDSTASHYLKIVLDSVFGVQHFKNEIIWRRKGGSALKDMNIFSNATDTILFYSKTEDYLFNPVFMPLDEEYIENNFTKKDENGRRFQATVLRSPSPRPNLMYDYKGYKMPPNGWAVSLEKMKDYDAKGLLYFPEDKSKQIYKKIYLDDYPGQPANNLWTDIKTLKGKSEELLGYPTQKPLALLERIINASSNPGDVVLDPFCGCGTAVHAAEKLGRNWIGIDITNLAISLIEKRLRDAFPSITFDVEGTPKDLASATDLALRDKYQFQWWACGLVNAQPYQGKKKGSDGGIDGLIFFQDDAEGAKKIIVSVKGGENISVAMIRDLVGTLEREKAEIGIFVTLAEPTKPMITEAVSAGYYESPAGKSYPKVQILTIEELLAKSKRAEYPDLTGGGLTFKKAQKEKKRTGQEGMF